MAQIGASRMASERATMYGLLFDVFVGLPGDVLLSQTAEGRLDPLLSQYGERRSVPQNPEESVPLLPQVGERRSVPFLSMGAEPGGPRICEGARLVDSYLASSEDGNPDVLVKELLVDRTRLLGSAGTTGFRPPYERLYIDSPAGEGSLLQALGRFYRNAGLALEDASGVPLDFLFVELDFMGRLCLREIEESPGQMPTGQTRATEREFLGLHLGKWAGAYCAEAEKYARTDFYRGFLAVLDGFVAAEMSYLGEP